MQLFGHQRPQQGTCIGIAEVNANFHMNCFLENAVKTRAYKGVFLYATFN